MTNAKEVGKGMVALFLIVPILDCWVAVNTCITIISVFVVDCVTPVLPSPFSHTEVTCIASTDSLIQPFCLFVSPLQGEYRLSMPEDGLGDYHPVSVSWVLVMTGFCWYRLVPPFVAIITTTYPWLEVSINQRAG